VTDENVRANVSDELAHAENALKAALALLDLGLAADAASRIYYAAFHAARALLFSLGVEAKTHRSTRSLLARHFVKTGRLPSAVSKELSQLEGLRMAGDYETGFALGADDLRPELEKAGRFVSDARTLLREDGWIDDQP
jgi:uncharacterized protein (UPF0332 family)